MSATRIYQCEYPIEHTHYEEPIVLYYHSAIEKEQPVAIIINISAYQIVNEILQAHREIGTVTINSPFKEVRD